MAMLSLVAASSATVWAGGPHKHLSLRHITAVRPDTTLTLLDSVVSDKYRKLYEYNDYGYITSKKVYQKGLTWELDSTESYEQTFAFAPNGKCTERVRYTLTPDGKRAQIESKGSIAQEGDLTWERYWETAEGLTYLSEANAYDKRGVLVIQALYDLNYMPTETSSEPMPYLSSYKETRYDYSRQLPAKSHCRFDLFEQEARTRVIEGRERIQWSVERDEYWRPFETDRAWRKTSEIVDGVLVIKEQGIPWSKEFNLDEIDSQWEGSEHETLRYTLNADGTRPVSLSRGGETTATWQWDSKGRLVKYTARYATETYTYADDYARTLTLQEVLDYHNGLTLYPEDELECFYGHAVTFRHENTSADDPYYEDRTMEYDALGRLSRVNWTEVCLPHDYRDENGVLVSPTDSTVERGFITFHYRADGHLDYEIDHLESGDRIKTQYTYDSKGTWTGEEEYYASSGEEVAWSNNPNTRHARHHRSASSQKHRIGEDLSEGNHHIQETDGAWIKVGEYYVNDGKINSGWYQEMLRSDAATPRDPELNYTDPETPFGNDDENCEDHMQAWIYHWSQETETWELSSAPSYLSRTYQDGALIKRDTYNVEKKIVRTDTYTKDSAGRLIKQEWTMTDTPEENGSYEYTYLDDVTNYLSTRQTHSTQDNETRRYHYSNRAYVTPTDIENAQAKAPKSDAYYDLQGRKVNHPTRGIYIHQGRKVVVK